MLATIAIASPAAAGYVRGPYLQDLGTRQVALLFELDSAQTAKLDVIRDKDPIKTATSEKDATHEIVVNGLEPATAYRYTLTLGDGTTEQGSFTTAPEDARPFSFIIYGDNRSNPYAHAAIVATIRKTPSEFLVHTGDMVYDGSQLENWKEFFSIEKDLLRERCVFPTIGNHEIAMPTSDGAQRYARMFRLPAPPDAAERWYTFRWGSARFFMLDAQDDFSTTERSWLEKALESAKNEAGVVQRFVVLHHGPYSSGLHGANESLRIARVPELLRSYKVDLVISGHDHIYERGDAAGLRYIISGGGGAPVYREFRGEKHTQKFEPVYHFVKIDVGSDIGMTAIRHDGSVIESCRLSATAGWGCGTTPAAAAPGAMSATPPAAPASPPAKPRSCGCTLVSGGSEWLGFVLAGVLAGAVSLRPRFRKR
jgi:acid phosphatase type 7